MVRPFVCIRDAAKKIYFFWRGGGKGLAIKEKRSFFPTANFRLPLRTRGGGVKALLALPLKKERKKKLRLPSAMQPSLISDLKRFIGKLIDSIVLKS